MNMTKQSLHLRLASLVLIGILGLGLSGCVGAVAGVGAAAVAAGTTEKGLGTSFNDGIIKTKISEAYFKEHVNLYSNIKIDVNIGSVLLTGDVEEPEQAVKAVQLAWQVNGVIEVINEIDVNNKASSRVVLILLEFNILVERLIIFIPVVIEGCSSTS